MLYLANMSTTPGVADAMRAGRLGMMCTPAEGRLPLAGATWAADNGCYGCGYPGDAAWLSWLRRFAIHADRCIFATAPDVLGDAAKTLRRARRFLPLIRELGYRAAYVAQDGTGPFALPWGEFDVLFIGGSTEWKLGPAARRLVKHAVARDVPVHFGRVNSFRRYRYAYQLGCASVDGTYLVFGPRENLPRLLRWAEAVAAGMPPPKIASGLAGRPAVGHAAGQTAPRPGQRTAKRPARLAGR